MVSASGAARAFFEKEPGSGTPVQVVDGPAEPQFDLPESHWIVRAREFGWEIESEMTWAELRTQGIAKAHWTTYFVSAGEGFFLATAALPTPGRT